MWFYIPVPCGTDSMCLCYDLNQLLSQVSGLQVMAYPRPFTKGNAPSRNSDDSAPQTVYGYGHVVYSPVGF